MGFHFDLISIFLLNLVTTNIFTNCTILFLYYRSMSLMVSFSNLCIVRTRTARWMRYNTKSPPMLFNSVATGFIRPILSCLMYLLWSTTKSCY
jgi:hypothetical protein